MFYSQTDPALVILIYVFIGIIITIILTALILFFMDFFRELRYLNSEIQCNHGAEREFWVRQRRRLWLSLIPFIKY